MNLKRIVGSVQLTGRLIAQDDITFNATHTMFINSNYRPGVAETDTGTWRRLRLLIFPKHYVKSEDDIKSYGSVTSLLMGRVRW